MVLLTMIARVADGLPLAASMQEDEQVGRSPIPRLPNLPSGRGASCAGGVAAASPPPVC